MRSIKLSSRMKSVAKISTGTVVGQIISIVTLPIITRIYGAEIMGIWTTIYAVSSIVITFCDIGLTTTIMVEESNDEVHTIYRVISTLSLVICALSSLCVGYYYLFCKESVSYVFAITSIVFIYAFTLSQVQTCYTWLNREKQYSVLMKNSVVNYSTVAIFSIGLGLLGFKQSGYFIGVTLGQVFTLIHMKRFLPSNTFILNFKVYKPIIVKYKEFIKYQIPTTFIVQIRQQIPNLMIGALFGNTMLGYFSVSQKLLSIPVTFIGQALGKVFFQTIAEMQRSRKNISEFVYRNLNRAMIIAVVPMVLMAAYGDAAIVMFFGADYGTAGTISRIIVFQSFFTFVSACTQGLEIVLNKQRFVMNTCIAQTILATFSVIIGFYVYDSIYICTFLMVISFIVVQIIYFCKIFSVMNYSAVKYLSSISISSACLIICSCILRYGFIFAADSLNCSFLNYLESFLVM